MAKHARGTEPTTGTDESRLGANIAWNYISGFTSVFGLLLLYPFAIRIVGAETYGLWVLASSAIQLLTMSDFGLGTGIVRSLTDLPDDAAHRRERRSLVAVAIGVFGVLAVILTAGYFVVFPLYLSTVQVPERNQDAVLPLVLAAGATLFISVLGRACNSVLWALNRPDIERKAAVVAILGRAAGYGLLIPLEGGLIAIVLVECISLLLPPLVCVWTVYQRFGLPTFIPGAWNKQGKPLLKMSSVLSIGSLSMLGVYQLPLFIVGPTLGLHATTAFGALMRVFQSARLIISWIVMPFGYPIKKSPINQAGRHIRMGFTVSILVGVLISVPLVALPNELLSVWLGGDFAPVAPALAVVTVGVMAEAIGQVPTLVMTMRGNPLIASLIGLAVLVLTVPAVWVAAGTGNLEYVMLAAVVPLLLLTPAQLYFSERTESSGTTARNLGLWVGMVAVGVVGIGIFLALGQVLGDLLTIIVCVLVLGIAFLGAFRTIRRQDAALNQEAVAA